MEVLPQKSEVNEPQVPERTWQRTCEGPDDIVIVSVEDWATNLYHTSNLSDAPQPGDGNVDGFHVELTFVPAVLTQEEFDVNVIALEQSSLDGCAKAAMVQKKIKEQTNRILLVATGWLYFGFIEWTSIV